MASTRARFYSTTAPNRNAPNSLQTNDRCTLHSTIDRGSPMLYFPRHPRRTTRHRCSGCHTMQSSFPCKSLKTKKRDTLRVSHNFDGLFPPAQSAFCEGCLLASMRPCLRIKCHTMQSIFTPISLKTKKGDPGKVSHFFDDPTMFVISPHWLKCTNAREKHHRAHDFGRMGGRKACSTNWQKESYGAHAGSEIGIHRAIWLAGLKMNGLVRRAEVRSPKLILTLIRRPFGEGSRP